MPKLQHFLPTLLLFIFSVDAIAQTVIRGRIVDKSTGNGIIGASVYLEDFNEGAFTDFDGFFQFKSRNLGQTNLIATSMGYEKVTKYISLTDQGLLRMGEIQLKSSAIGLEEADVIASVAIDRATPVAVSTIDAQLIEEKQGDRELVEMLNFTPGVYATKGGGGFGDSRINIRGFDQINVAVLVNGIPVNDMENGRLYWSNWAGIGDAVRSMQVQRGLGASKLAINSVGGTINIVTKATDAQAGGSFKSSITNYGRNKHLLSLSSGKLDNGWALSAVGSRTYGEGYVDATWVDAWSYFVTAAKDFGRHRIVFTAIGAPQSHGQRRGQLTVDRFNEINNLPDSLGFQGHTWNQDWGYLDGDVLNTKVNSYYKPQIALNHYLSISAKSHLSTSVYISKGVGYGTGFYDKSSAVSSPRRPYIYFEDDSLKGLWNLDSYFEDNENNPNPQTASYYDDVIGLDEQLGTWTDTLHYEGDPILVNGESIVGGESRYLIKNAHNEHFWTGLLSTLKSELSPNLNLIAGVDMRYYEGKHYRTVSNLLGGDYYLGNFSSGTGYGINPEYNLMTSEGDVVDYDNVGIVKYAGLFAQLEYQSEKISAFIAGTGSFTGYQRYDPYTYFRYEQTGVQEVTTLNEETGEVETSEEFVYGKWSEKASAPGYNAKAGGSYAITDKNHLYLNLGIYSRAPFIKNVFPNYQNVLSNDNLVNEKVEALEVGYRLRGSRISLDVNFYHTKWKDKTIMSGPLLRPDGTEYRAFVRGLTETHDGFEIESKAKPLPLLELGTILSVGHWRWDNNVEAEIMDEGTGQVEETLNIYSAGLKVGDAPQTQLGVNARMDWPKNFRIGASYVYNTRLYARFSVDQDRDAEEMIGVQPVELPSFGYVDGFVNWHVNKKGLDYSIGLNIQNATNNIYMNEAIEDFTTDPYTGEPIQDSYDNGELMGFWAFGRTISVSAKVGF